MKALLPVFFLALLSLWSGTFAGGATSSGAVSAHAALLTFCLVGAAGWRDPLDLGRFGKWLVPALLLAVAASWWAGSAQRAGVLALLLLPTLLLVPSAVASCWRGQQARRLGVAGLCLLLALVSAVALARWQFQGSPRAAMPLGHHNLLAAWLVIVWPVGLLVARWRGGGRAVAATASALAVAALAASGSFLASCALLVQALIGALWWKQARLWLALAILAVWLGPAAGRLTVEYLSPSSGPAVSEPAPGQPSTQLERAQNVISGEDRSSRVRTVYARAGWEGFVQRLILGWGPGSVPWTVARFLDPVSGLNPPSEIVGDLHSWPIHLGYETGMVGLVLSGAIVLLFARRRLAELWHPESLGVHDAPLLRAACLGLLGGAIVLAGNAPAHILALPAAVAIVAGAALCAGRRPLPHSRRASLALGLLYVCPVALLLLPLERAHHAYQQATLAKNPYTALEHIRRASRIDPEFPLYLARAAWLAANLEGPDQETAEEALRAAQKAQSLAPLWLAAGAMGLEVGRPWAEKSLARARALDPLSPLPPFHLLRARPDRPDAVELGAFALSSEPLLRAAVFWEEHPELFQRVLERLGQDAAVASGARSAQAEDPTVRLALSMDRESAVSFSLYAFRRSPWATDLAPVELRRSGLGPVVSR